MKKLSFIPLLIILLVHIQCGGGGDRTQSGTTPVTIKVIEVTQGTGSGADQLSGAVMTGNLASAVEQVNEEGRQLSLCRITITGPGMADMVREVDVAGKSSIRETFMVPSGENRSFLIQMFVEHIDKALYQAFSPGNSLINKPVTIEMRPEFEDAYYEAPAFSGIYSIENSETKSVMLKWEPASDNITEQDRIRYLVYLSHESLSSREDVTCENHTDIYMRGKGLPGEDPSITINGETGLMSYEYDGSLPESETTPSLNGENSDNGKLSTGVAYYFIVEAQDEWGNVDRKCLESEPVIVYQLEVNTVGSGRVTTEPKGIDCGVKCSEDFLSKNPITLIAKEDDGAVFDGWEGNEQCYGTEDCILTLKNNESVTATFSTIGNCTNGKGEPVNEGQSCDDGQFCTEGETCQNGTCTGGITRTCSDGVGCTDDSCDDVNDTCLNTPNNGNCQDNGQFCDGTEICDPVNDCLTDGDPCLEGETCDELQDTCVPPVQCGNGTMDEGEECDDGPANGTTVCGCQTNCTYTPASTPCLDNEFCNGDEICDGAGTCQPGIPVDCSDDVGCTDDLCDDVNDTCLNTPNNGNCQDNGQYCDGTESCDPVHDCLSSGDPCQQGETCDEEQNKCIPPVLCGNGTVEQGEECDDGPSNGSIVCGCQLDCTYTSVNTSCADGAFCNGDETCDGAGTCRTGTPPCPAGTTCNESDDACPVDCTDKDNDGYAIEGGDTCGPVDCDDNDGNNHPGNTEVCDDQDNDCDDKVDESFGDKGDSCTVGEGECKRTGSMVCNANGTGTTCDATPGSSSEEICDGKDNDCDGDTDENGKALCDNGEFCDGKETCTGTGGCKDGSPPCPAGITCNESSDTCPDCTDKDKDGYAVEGGSCGPVDCDDNNPVTYPGAQEICDGKDNNCNGIFHDVETDSDGDGYFPCEGDCNDGDNKVYPDAPELCDKKDNDCDGNTDENLSRSTSCGVGECSGNKGTETCNNGAWGNDTCNPYAGSSKESPPGSSVCSDKADNDCDGDTDQADGGCQECTPGDTEYCNTGLPGVCKTGLRTCGSNYLWGTCEQVVNLPGGEICDDNLDNDCDGEIDEECKPVIDQNNSPSWDGAWTNIVPINKVGQTFMPDKSPLIGVSVDIITGNPGSGDDKITMKIIDEKGQVLASNTLFVSDGFAGWLHFDIPGGITVDSKRKYVLQLNDSGKVTFGWKYGSNTYPDGNFFFYGSPDYKKDFFFRTYTWAD